MKITENFSREEFACKDKAKTPYPCKWIDSRLFPLCQALEKIRAKLCKVCNGEIKIKINSGYRTPEYNAHPKIKGSKNSLHMKGLAVDFRVVSNEFASFITIKQVHSIIEAMIQTKEIPDGGLGLYKSFIHYDQRGKHSRWKG